MMLKDFLQRVVPSAGGNFWGGFIDPQGTYHQRTYHDLDALVAFIESQTRQRRDVYFATGVYNGPRKSKLTAGKKALYVDLDCGHGKPYGTQKEALKALLQWSKDHFTLPSIIVNSGGGVHAYWTFTHVVALSQWQPVAEQFKNRLEEGGLKVDEKITTDAARILRPPGTVNYKRAAPAPVEVLWSQPEDYEFDRLRAMLDVLPPPVLAGLPSVGESDLSAGVGDGRPRLASKLIPLCNVFSSTLEVAGKDVPGLAWTHQLSILAHCVDGADYVHAMSSDHDEYVPAATDRKWERALSKVGSIGPPRCDTFAGFFPEKCAGCAYRGLITTPLQLGGEVRMPDAMPWPFQQDEKGVFYMATKKDDEGRDVSYRHEIVPFMIEEMQVLESPESTLLAFNAKYPGLQEEVLLDYSDLMEKRSALTELSRHHIPIGDRHYAGFRDLMSSWAMQMKAAKRSKPMVSHLGWVTMHGKTGFATGDKIFWEDGSVDQNSHRSRQLVAMYTPKGSDAEWHRAAGVLLGQGREAITALVLSSFASPLVKFTAAPGVILSFVSRESGSGKSTAMKLAQAVWGDPVAGVNALNDTPASVIHKISYTNNLPAYWDEVRVRAQAADFIKMIYSISQGKERSRLRSDISMQHVGTWSTMMICASNESLADHAEQVVEDSESGRVRIFEVNVPVIAEHEADPQLYRHINALKENYGMVGQTYAEFLARNHDMVKSLVGRVGEALAKELDATQTDRFWVSAMTALICAAALVTKAGIATINAAQLKKWLVSQLSLQRGSSLIAYAPTTDKADQLVTEWSNEFRQQLIVCDKLRKKGGKAGSTISIAPVNGAVLGVLALEDRILRVDYRQFRDWLYKARGESPSQIIAQLCLKGAMESKAVLDAGLPNSIGQRLRCLDIPLPNGDD